MTIIQGSFEWDSEKDMANIKKHGVSFREIIDVFDDPWFYEIYDKHHSTDTEERLIGIGANKSFYVFVISHTETKRIRIISARHATTQERKVYYDRIRNFNSSM